MMQAASRKPDISCWLQQTWLQLLQASQRWQKWTQLLSKYQSAGANPELAVHSGQQPKRAHGHRHVSFEVLPGKSKHTHIQQQQQR
jgi:hypothetical protein